MAQCCATCIYSRWPLTPTGRISRVRSGRCIYVVKLPPLPDSVREKPYVGTCGVGADDGKTCPVYELNDGEPIEELEIFK